MYKMKPKAKVTVLRKLIHHLNAMPSVVEGAEGMDEREEQPADSSVGAPSMDSTGGHSSEKHQSDLKVSHPSLKPEKHSGPEGGPKPMGQKRESRPGEQPPANLEKRDSEELKKALKGHQRKDL